MHDHIKKNTQSINYLLLTKIINNTKLQNPHSSPILHYCNFYNNILPSSYTLMVHSSF